MPTMTSRTTNFLVPPVRSVSWTTSGTSSIERRRRLMVFSSLVSKSRRLIGSLCDGSWGCCWTTSRRSRHQPRLRLELVVSDSRVSNWPITVGTRISTFRVFDTRSTLLTHVQRGLGGIRINFYHHQSLYMEADKGCGLLIAVHSQRNSDPDNVGTSRWLLTLSHPPLLPPPSRSSFNVEIRAGILALTDRDVSSIADRSGGPSMQIRSNGGAVPPYGR